MCDLNATAAVSAIVGVASCVPSGHALELQTDRNSENLWACCHGIVRSSTSIGDDEPVQEALVHGVECTGRQNMGVSQQAVSSMDGYASSRCCEDGYASGNVSDEDDLGVPGKKTLVPEYYRMDEQSVGVQAVPRTKTRGCQAMAARRDKSTQTAKK